ncbi:unnamed protein product [Candida verbasci]|uniref:LYC1 C-terminal domain-containing protein n=1 Tax=Candida verbasci TaxID=1227364 RepID=A0A9W4TXC9_9ASCO|nr:unnamed protein product [Candida verbasci]
MAPSLSNSTPVEFKLVQLTDQDHINFTRCKNGQTWKGDLSVDDYILREHTLGKSKLINDNLLVYMLQDQNKIPLCSVEILIRPGWKFEYNNGEADVLEVKCGTIGSVFTYPENRGKGYSRIMIDKLVRLCKEDIIGQEGFTFLYSEIGEYYTKHGFKSYPVDTLSIPLKDQDLSPIEASYEFIPYHQFEPLMSKYNEKLKSEIIEKVKKDHKTRVSIIPDSHIIDWFHLRAKYLSYKLYHEKSKTDRIDFYNEDYQSIISKLENEEPNVYGIKMEDDTGFIIWTVDFKDDSNSVTILKCVSFENDDSVVLKLLHLLKNHISKRPILGQETTKITLWESEVSLSCIDLIKSQFVGVSIADNSSRSAIMINNDKQDKLLKNDDIIWEENTKLPWF